MTIFAELGLNKTLQANVLSLGYKSPTYIQEHSIGAVLSGTDTYAIAPTGTGKTAAYLLPTLQELSRVDNSAEQVRPVRALFLVPTRELAVQVEESIAKYGKGLNLRTISVFGGVRIPSQVNRFKRGADIVVATPRRLVDLLKVKAFSLEQVKHFVMDEADRLVSMGIVAELRTILAAMPQAKQQILFSATDSKALQKFAADNLVNPKEVRTDDSKPALDKIIHTMYRCHRDHKPDNLLSLINLVNCDHALIFARTKKDVTFLTHLLNSKGYSSVGIHNEIPQKQRQVSLNSFKNREVQFLVATDIVSRGIDITDLYYVINFDLPVNCNDYIHRVGRTARTASSQSVDKEMLAEKANKQAASREITASKYDFTSAPAEVAKDIQGHIFSLVCTEQDAIVPRISKAVGKEIKVEWIKW